MSQPLIDLQRLLMAQTTTSGQVVSVTNGIARVATPDGIIEVSVEAGIQPGDRVTVSNGRAIKNQGATNTPVHFV